MDDSGVLVEDFLFSIMPTVALQQSIVTPGHVTVHCEVKYLLRSYSNCKLSMESSSHLTRKVNIWNISCLKFIFHAVFFFFLAQLGGNIMYTSVFFLCVCVVFF